MQRQSGFKLSPFDIKCELVDSTHNQCLMDQNVRNDHAATWTSIAAHAHMIHVHFATGRPSTIIGLLGGWQQGHNGTLSSYHNKGSFVWKAC